MNNTACYNGSNNVYTGFPALMSSGHFPKSTASKSKRELKKNNGIEDNYGYRQFLINNADNLILYNQEKACDRCCGCLQNFKPRSDSQKYLSKQKSTSKSHFSAHNDSK